jgi:hypothetical protein
MEEELTLEEVAALAVATYIWVAQGNPEIMEAINQIAENVKAGFEENEENGTGNNDTPAEQS